MPCSPGSDNLSISLRHIEIFRAVMHAGSVTGAARLLFSSQPTVSRELARLEVQLGMRLFDREQGRLAPTAQALMLFDEVQRSFVGLERIASVAESIRRFDQGRLAITCLPLFAQVLLPPACVAFKRRYPAVGLSITAQESPLLEASLSSQRFDLGLTESLHLPRGTRGSELFRGDMVCVLPDGHPLLAKASLALEDFQHVDFVSFAAEDNYRQLLDEQFQRAGVSRNLVIETSTAASLCALVRGGLGVAIVNPLSARGEGLAWRPLRFAVAFRVTVIQPDYRPTSPLAQAFIECLEHHLQPVGS